MNIRDGQGLELPLSYPETWVVDVKSVGTGQQALISILAAISIKA